MSASLETPCDLRGTLGIPISAISMRNPFCPDTHCMSLYRPMLLLAATAEREGSPNAYSDPPSKTLRELKISIHFAHVHCSCSPNDSCLSNSLRMPHDQPICANLCRLRGPLARLGASHHPSLAGDRCQPDWSSTSQLRLGHWHSSTFSAFCEEGV